MGRADLRTPDALLRFYLGEFKPDALNVHTVHAEVEGAGHLETLAALVRTLKERGAKFLRLEEIAARLDAAELPACEVARTTLAGRAGWVSAQGREVHLDTSAAQSAARALP